MEDKVITATLSNGLRVAAASTDGNVCYCGVLANAGSSEDPQELYGLAHFVEHTIFKGTEKRSSLQISNRLELIGGELNAYTTKENIMVYATVPMSHEDRALETLADLVTNARFPADEINMERGVVLEEINSYHDNPSYAVYDEFDEHYFKGNALAHNILGYDDTVSRITGGDAKAFLERWFTPDNMVVYCLAPQKPEKTVKMLEKRFGTLRREYIVPVRHKPVRNGVFDVMCERGNRQANVIVGGEACEAASPHRFAWFLLSNLLGGPAMNSLLNSQLREKRGLVYTVDSSLALYEDTGVMQIYFGCDPHNVDKCTRLVSKEIARLAEKPLGEAAFKRATRQICGQLLVSSDNRESYAMMLGKSLMRFGRIIDTKQVAARISELTPDELQEAAMKLASNPMSRLIIC